MFRSILMLAAALLAANAAQAEVHNADAFNQLTAVPQKPGHAPRLVHGMSELSSAESRHSERLPLQLDGAIKKIKRTKYAPKGLKPAPALRSAKAGDPVPAALPRAQQRKLRHAKHEHKAPAHKNVAARTKVALEKLAPAASYKESLPMPLPAPAKSNGVARENPTGF